MQYLRVKDWDRLQHYNKRTPPWIRLYRDLLNDYEFTCLQDASKLQLILIWLLASQMDNKIPADPEFIKRRINISGKLNLKELIDKGFLIDASNALASCKQNATPETETDNSETETETESLGGFSFPENWNTFLTFRKEIKKPVTKSQQEALLRKIHKLASESRCMPEEIIEQSISQGWQGVFELKENNRKDGYGKQPSKSDEIHRAFDELKRSRPGAIRSGG